MHEFPNSFHECSIRNPHSFSSPYGLIDCGDFCVLGCVDANTVFPFCIQFNDVVLHEFGDSITERILFWRIRMQQLAQQENLGRVEVLCRLCLAEVAVAAAKGDPVEVGQVIQHGQEVEGFRVPFSFIIDSDLVAFQELGDKGEIAQVFELVAGVASELLEGGTIGFFFKHNCVSLEIIFCGSVEMG